MAARGRAATAARGSARRSASLAVALAAFAALATLAARAPRGAHAQVPRSRLYGPPAYDPTREELPDYAALPYHAHRLARTPTPAGLMLGPGAASQLLMLSGEPGGEAAARPRHDLGLRKSVRDWWKYHWQGKHGKVPEDFEELEDPAEVAKRKRREQRRAKKRAAKQADLSVPPDALEPRVQSVGNEGEGTAEGTADALAARSSPLVLPMSPDVVPLRELYEACWGYNWKARRSWMSGDPCTDHWDGVVCSGGRVTELVLNYQNVLCEYGNDTAWADIVSQMTELKYLDMSNNYLRGEIPESLSRLTNLQVLVIGCQGDKRLGAGVAQGLPAWLGDLQELRVLDLSDNALAGPLPPELGRLSKLQVLKLSKNQLRGPIPEEWGALSNLEVLDLSDNALGGTFPAWEWEPTRLLQLAPMEDALQGALPPRPPLGALPAATVPSGVPSLGSAEVAAAKAEAGRGMREDGGAPAGKRADARALAEDECSDDAAEEARDSEEAGSGAIVAAAEGERSLAIPGEGRLMLPMEYMSEGWYWEADGCRLREVSLANSKLKGGLPNWLWGCAWLSILDMSGNAFDGPMPSEVLYLRGLSHLRLSGNRYTGSILPGLGALPHLYELDVSINRLTGTLPADLLESKSLMILKASSNRLSGPIPEELGEMEGLRILELGYNRFTGGVPDALTRAPVLTHLDLSGNGLVGGVPPALGAMPRLTILNLNANPLGGTLPPELGNATRLQSLSIAGASLRGTLPAVMGSLSELAVLNLASNALTGAIPGEWGGMYWLHDLDLSHNKLSGELDARLGGMASLRELKLSHNRLSGALPARLGRDGFFHSLETVDLAHNDLHGVLPADLLDPIPYKGEMGEPLERTLNVNVGQNSFWCPLPDWAQKVSASCQWLEVHSLAYPGGSASGGGGSGARTLALLGSGFVRSLADGLQCVFGSKKVGLQYTDAVWESASRVLCVDVPEPSAFKKSRDKFGDLQEVESVIVRLAYNGTVLTKFGQEHKYS